MGIWKPTLKPEDYGSVSGLFYVSKHAPCGCVACRAERAEQGELRAVETKAGIENVFQQGIAQGRTEGCFVKERDDE